MGMHKGEDSKGMFATSIGLASGNLEVCDNMHEVPYDTDSDIEDAYAEAERQWKANHLGIQKSFRDLDELKALVKQTIEEAPHGCPNSPCMDEDE